MKCRKCRTRARGIFCLPTLSPSGFISATRARTTNTTKRQERDLDRIDRLRRLCPDLWRLGVELESPEPADPDDGHADDHDDGTEMVHTDGSTDQ